MLPSVCYYPRDNHKGLPPNETGGTPLQCSACSLWDSTAEQNSYGRFNPKSCPFPCPLHLQMQSCFKLLKGPKEIPSPPLFQSRTRGLCPGERFHSKISLVPQAPTFVPGQRFSQTLVTWALNPISEYESGNGRQCESGSFCSQAHFCLTRSWTSHSRSFGGF